MKAIVTKYQGPTDFRGSRILAYDEDGNRTACPYDAAGSWEDAHRLAAIAFAERMGLTGTLIGGSTGGPFYAWVWVQTLDVNPRLVGVAYARASSSNVDVNPANVNVEYRPDIREAMADAANAKDKQISDILDILGVPDTGKREN